MSPVSPQIDTYLSQMLRPLQRTVDETSLANYHDNALFHLEELVKCHEATGVSREEALSRSLAEYGEPYETGLALLDEWCRGRAGMAFARTSSASLWWTFAIFGIADAVTLLVTEVANMWPGGVILDPYTIGLRVLAPVIAGAVTGYVVPTGNLRALCFTLIPLVFHALIASFFIVPYEVGSIYTGTFVLAWAPLGAVSIAVTSWLRRNRPSRRPARRREAFS